MFPRGAVDRLIANRVGREKKIRRLMAERNELIDEVRELRRQLADAD